MTPGIVRLVPLKFLVSLESGFGYPLRRIRRAVFVEFIRPNELVSGVTRSKERFRCICREKSGGEKDQNVGEMHDRYKAARMNGWRDAGSFASAVKKSRFIEFIQNLA
jgi:hypothetical protein